MGMAVLLIYSIISLVKLQKRLRHAAHEKDNIYIAEHLDTPFVMGFMRPKIYLPASLSEGEKRCILLHERMHIRRFDHVIKIVSFFVLCLHWFNPLVWIAFLISGKDMEMSCDEAVIKELGGDVKKEYSSSLLALATGRRIIGGSPLAFGEGDT
jgi:beta-lactamase regulating signal transducer with metallopeptidase domain